jgi:hypothetical protein
LKNPITCTACQKPLCFECHGGDCIPWSQTVNKVSALILVGLALACASCTAPDSATRALTGAGYKNVVLTGYRFTGCGEGDTFHTGFQAQGPTGQAVSGVVCSGILKGSTIRLD